jgi:hypothetical protein
MSQGHFAHDYLGAQHDENARRTRWVVALTAVMMVGEIVAGYATGSMALLADGFHMGTHAGALGVAALAYSYARRHARNPRFSFGTGKVGDLAGFASALILGVFAIGIAVESVARLMEPIRVEDGVCVDDEGTLAGSDLDMAQAVRNTVALLGQTPAQALAMAAAVPARFLGLDDRYGAIRKGARASLVRLDADLRCRATWIEGRDV